METDHDWPVKVRMEEDSGKMSDGSGGVIISRFIQMEGVNYVLRREIGRVVYSDGVYKVTANGMKIGEYTRRNEALFYASCACLSTT